MLFFKQVNRLFPSYPVPRFQDESLCKTCHMSLIDMKMNQ